MLPFVQGTYSGQELPENYPKKLIHKLNETYREQNNLKFFK